MAGGAQLDNLQRDVMVIEVMCVHVGAVVD